MRERVFLMASLVAALPLVSFAQPKDPCAPLVAEAAQLLGGAAGKPEPVISWGSITRCAVPSADRNNTTVVLTRERGASAQRLMMNAMIAERSESTKGAFHKEPSLGANAFSLQQPTDLLFSFAGAGEALGVQLLKEGGVTPGDIERVRAFARRLQAMK